MSEIARYRTPKRKLKTHPIDDFPIDIVEVQTGEGRLHLFAATDRTSKFAFVATHDPLRQHLDQFIAA